MFDQASRFIRLYYEETERSREEMESRLADIKRQIERTGTYWLTTDELSYGVKMAWRNSNKCIGRLFWNTLHLFDHRNSRNPEAIFQALFEHIRFATNGGAIRPAVTIFPSEGVRIWNHQLIRYAGYETANGIVGDPDSLAFTAICQQLGWKGKGSQFDVLPLVIQIGEEKPIWREIPRDLILEVNLRHPEMAWFEALQLKWYAVPIISSMMLEVGGIRFPAAPFNGWYMGTEIGARNLADADRYNLLPVIAEKMGLDMTTNTSLWKDRALVELNAAVLYSYREDHVSIVDHHSAAFQFKQFELREEKEGRAVTGNWVWLIPPMSPATTHIFHKPYDNKILRPNFFYQPLPYQE